MRTSLAGALAAALVAVLAVAAALAAAPRPSAELTAPRVNSDSSRNRTAQLTWSGRGSGTLHFRLEYRRNTEVASRWRTIRPTRPSWARASAGARG